MRALFVVALLTARLALAQAPPATGGADSPLFSDTARGPSADATAAPADPLSELTLDLGAFGDVNGALELSPTTRPSFGLGIFDLFFTSQAPHGFSFLGELAIEANPENGVELDLERLQATWRLDERLSISLGRMQQSLGYYNTAYHAAAFLMTACDRPLIVAFADQGGVLPVHMVGVEVAGEVRPGPLTVGYALDLANGRGADVEEVLNTFDTNGAKSANLLVYLALESLGLRVGGNALFDFIPADTVVGAERPALNEQIFGGHLLFERRQFTLLGEGYLVRQWTQDVPQSTIVGAFVETSLQLGLARPFLRGELLTASGAQSLFIDSIATGESTLRGLAGVRLDLARRTALKLQLDARHHTVAGLTLSARVQLAFAF